MKRILTPGGLKKSDQAYYGYKAHAKADLRSKLIDSVKTTSSNVHDSQVTEPLLTDSDKGQELYADSGYSGKGYEATYKNM